MSKFEEEEEAVTNLMHKRIETVEQVACSCSSHASRACPTYSLRGQEKLQLKKRLHEMQVSAKP